MNRPATSEERLLYAIRRSDIDEGPLARSGKKSI